MNVRVDMWQTEILMRLSTFGNQKNNIPLEIIRDSISWLQKREDVKNGWMGMHGVSRGAELALWSGVLFDEIKAIVSLNGSGVSFAGITPWTEEPNLLPAWMYKGEALEVDSIYNAEHATG